MEKDEMAKFQTIFIGSYAKYRESLTFQEKLLLWCAVVKDLKVECKELSLDI